MDFVPHDEKTVYELLNAIGVDSVDQLFEDIPKDLRIDKLDIPEGLSEPELLHELTELSRKNRTYSSSFLGAGCYYHYIPSLVDFIISRSEFYTSYTPYQAEASQGFLQAIYEYQTAISRLTHMDISNASMYDGSTAMAEAIIMASAVTRRDKVLLLEGIHPEYVEVARTYCWGHNIEYEIVSIEDFSTKIDDQTAAIVIQNPLFFGDILDLSSFVNKIRESNSKCLIIQVMTDPTCLGILKAPGECDIDIFIAEGQSFGMHPSFGGPGLGIFATKKRFMRKIPGRLVGKTTEINGEGTGFLLTLQAREQHIRREKAISNICTNQALCMLSALIYLLSMGKYGLKEIAAQNIQKAYFLKDRLSKIDGFKPLNKNPTYNEFTMKVPNADYLIQQCEEKNILAPLKLSKYFPERDDQVLICVTELNSHEDIENFIQIAKETTK
ncbi:MAG: putative glycine dehydrogenase (decarboxylating) subunit 1 [Promethearchaeota archaeon]|nr:MAG: putative glycine dehydrogenase (decarboxylating) subunit 1 [Candidatus Lokiarchaeota archaeon]